MNILQINKEQGFTLIELMVVIIIIGILAGYYAPKLMGRPEEARRAKTALQISGLETALHLYKLDNSVYPSTTQGLEALITPPSIGKTPKNWRKGGYLAKSKIPKDAWGNPFVYISPGVHGEYDLSSFGSDGESGGEENNRDINNWELE